MAADNAKKTKAGFNLQFPCLMQSAKLPKNIPKDAWMTYKSENAWSRAMVAVDGDDAWILLKGSGMEIVAFRIPDYRSRSLLEIEGCVDGYFAGCTSETYPLGRNFDDCLGWLCEHGMKVGYLKQRSKK